MKSASKTSRPFWYKPPGAKSLANRVLILRALSQSKTKIINLPDSDDVKIMQEALESIQHGKTLIQVENAGTVCRFLCAAAPLLNKKVILDGVVAMRRRPIRDLVTALKKLGAKITYLGEKGYLPIQITPASMHGGKIEISMEKSSQYSSALALIAPFLPGGITIKIVGKRRSESYFETTLQLLRQWGVKIEQKNSSQIVIHESIKPPKDYAIEPDIASSSYFYALAKFHHTKLPSHQFNTTIQAEREFFTILKNLDTLKVIDAKNIPDTALTLAVLAPLLNKPITFKNISHLQYKESNRLATLSKELRKIGAKVQVGTNSMNITPPKALIKNAIIQTHGDHRIAMAFSLIKSLFPQTAIKNPEVVQKSYPKFWEDFRTFHLSLNKNIVLIGMPGSGKTTLAKTLAQKWKYTFLDLDDLFEQKHQATIADFVAEHGYADFRKKETALLASIKPNTKLIISTGGGVINNAKNRERLEKLGTIVYLKESITTLTKRIKGSKRHALFQKNTNTILKKLELQRDTLYKETAHITLKGDNIQKKIQLLEQQLFSHAV